MNSASCFLKSGWDQVISNLPQSLDLEKSAKELGALVRARQIKSAKDLLHLIFAYSFCHMSFRETASWAAFSEIANISDVALIKRLRNSLPWLESILYKCLQDKWQGCNPLSFLGQFRLIDATYIKPIGPHSSQWRIHTSYNPHTLSFDYFQITNSHGAENVGRFPLRAGDIVIADRGYAKSKQIRYLLDQKVHYIIRTGYQSCSLRYKDGTKFDLLGEFRLCCLNK
jgi:hypothetical protein